MRVGVLLFLALMGVESRADAPNCEPLRQQAIEAREKCGPDRKDECERSRSLAAQYKQCYIQTSRENIERREQRERDIVREAQAAQLREIAAQKQLEQSQEEAHAARINAIKSDPRKMGIAFGAGLCYVRRIRSDSSTEIAKEKKYASIGGGVVNKEKLYQLQKRLRWADEAESSYRSKLKIWKGLTVAPCHDATVKLVVACKLEGDDACANEIGTYAEFVDDAPGVDES